jgi:hypothetical protein
MNFRDTLIGVGLGLTVAGMTMLMAALGYHFFTTFWPTLDFMGRVVVSGAGLMALGMILAGGALGPPRMPMPPPPPTWKDKP